MTDHADAFGHVGILGAGAWGTALALVAAQAGRAVTLWTRNPTVAAEIAARRQNARYLPGITLPQALRVTTDPAGLAGVDAVLSVIPTQYMRAELPAIAAVLADPARAMPVAICAKGLERGTGLRVQDVLAAVWPTAAPALLSGPSFAADVARGLPTAVTLADADAARARCWAQSLATPAFRPYVTDDLVGVALGGAIKNVLAIACGVAVGQGLGESARAALVTRGFAEATRFAVAAGARAETLAGLSGLGDLILTCGSAQSRNMSLGVEIGRGADAAPLLAGRHTVAEGAMTAGILVSEAKRLGVDMPIARCVAEVLDGRLNVADALAGLLGRPLRPESSTM